MLLITNRGIFLAIGPSTVMPKIIPTTTSARFLRQRQHLPGRHKRLSRTASTVRELTPLQPSTTLGTLSPAVVTPAKTQANRVLTAEGSTTVLIKVAPEHPYRTVIRSVTDAKSAKSLHCLGLGCVEPSRFLPTSDRCYGSRAPAKPKADIRTRRRSRS